MHSFNQNAALPKILRRARKENNTRLKKVRKFCTKNLSEQHEFIKTINDFSFGDLVTRKKFS